MEMTAYGSVELLIYQEPPSVTVQMLANTIMSEFCKQMWAEGMSVSIYSVYS